MPIIDQLKGPTRQDLSLQGRPGPTFESLTDRVNSDIQARISGTTIQSSQDLLSGRNITRRGLGLGGASGAYFRTPSAPPVSFPNAFVGKPFYPSLGGPYSSAGPREGRY